MQSLDAQHSIVVLIDNRINGVRAPSRIVFTFNIRVARCKEAQFNYFGAVPGSVLEIPYRELYSCFFCQKLGVQMLNASRTVSP